MFSRAHLALSAAFLCVFAPTASAFNPQPEPPGFGAIGIVGSQTARLNLSFVAAPAPERGSVPPGPCAGTIQLQFLDAAGNVVAEKTARLTEGGSDALELTGGTRGGRTQVRARATWVDYPPGPCRSGALLGNVEVYDNATGETTLVLPGM